MAGEASSNTPSDGKGLFHLSGHLALLAATGSVIAVTRGSLLVLPALILHGIVLVFLFAPLHESLHRTAFCLRWLNVGVAWFAGLVLLLPPDWFRAFHFAHHRYTQIEGSDPELDGKRVETWPDYLIHLSGWRYWKGSVVLIVRNAAGRTAAPYVSPRLEARLVREARIMLAVYAVIAVLSLAFRTDAAIIYWVVPALLGQPFLRAYLLAGAYRPAAGREFLGEHTDDADRRAAAVRCLEHAVPRRAPCRSVGAVPCSG